MNLNMHHFKTTVSCVRYCHRLSFIMFSAEYNAALCHIYTMGLIYTDHLLEFSFYNMYGTITSAVTAKHSNRSRV